MSLQDIRSRDNPLLARVRRLARGGTAYRKEGAVWIEGEHLCQAWLDRGGRAREVLISTSAWEQPALRALAQRAAARTWRLPDALFASLSALEAPSGLGFVIDLPAEAAIDPAAASLVLDRVQDAGNVGSLLRSAAAFGFAQVLALQGTAGLWSPKVLRAGMGAHFALRLREGLREADLKALAVPLLATSSHAEQAIDQAPLPYPCAWVLGHEGQGVSAGLLAHCGRTLRIPQPGGEESLNVAAAGAICLFATRQSTPWR